MLTRRGVRGSSFGLAAVAWLAAASLGCSPRTGSATDEPLEGGARVAAPDAGEVAVVDAGRVGADADADARDGRGGGGEVAPGEAGAAGVAGAGRDAGRRFSVPSLVLGRLALADGPVKRGAAHRSYREALRLLGGDDVEGARAALERAVAAEPSYTLALGSLAVVHLRAGRHEACAVVSAQCVERAFEAEHLGACYFNLGACLEHLGDEAGAYEALRASLEARDNEAAAKTVARLARRLRRPAAPATDRAEREGLVRRAAASYFESTCGRAAFPADRPGVATCGEAAAWGDAGAFSGAGRQEVLLAVADGGAAPEGFGVLMREVDGRFRVVARTRLLAPGRGGVDFLGRLRLVDGRDVSIVQSSSCEGGCCTGWVRALRAESQADGAAISATRLVPVGTTRTDDGQTVIQALVTGVRLLAGPDGPSPVLRYETRFGRANPDVSYLRVVERDGAAAIVGRFPAASAVPACRPVASDHGSPDAAATVAE